MANETQIERYQRLKKLDEKLQKQCLQIETEIKIKTEEYEKAFKEMCEKYDVSSFDELRALRKQKAQENNEILNQYEEELAKQQKVLEEVSEKLEEVKQNLDG